MSVLNTIKKEGLLKAYDYLDKDPEKNLPNIMDWVDKYSMGMFKSQRQLINDVLADPDSPWYKLLISLWDNVDSGVRKTLFTNFVINAGVLGMQRQNEIREKENCNVPWAILIDPTSACNLHCTGCWAAEYGNKLNLTFDELDDIIQQGKDMGTYMYIYTGGEPLVRKDDIIKLCEKHNDCAFLAFTNATLIDEDFANEMLRVQNFVPAISVEGFEEATDFRRGEGTYKKIRAAMELLREKKLPFGVSCCYTSKNAYEIGSEEYIDSLIEWGALFCWIFTYMPIGGKAVTDLIATAEQREYMYRQVRKFRESKPIFTMDFWNDGEYVNGCIAGGRYYLHINANGDIEPCAFVHFSDSNIRDTTLLEAYKRPLFMGYHDHQPFNENYMQPCPVLDNPDAIVEIVNGCDCKSTDLEEPEDVETLTSKTREAAKNWEPVADRIWNTEYHKKRNARVQHD
ncbi:MAG: radical SAM protein [Anaerovoracaceae bacterium]|nr:radical SAM protein [Anaerovoracaceae bacterium]